MAQVWMLTSPTFIGVISDTLSGQAYSVKPGQKVLVDELDEDLLLAFGFTAAPAVVGGDNNSGIVTVSVAISQAQLTSLDSVPIDIVPPPGANKVVRVIQGAVQYKAGIETFGTSSVVQLYYTTQENGPCIFDINFSSLSDQLAYVRGDATPALKYTDGNLTNVGLHLYMGAGDLGIWGPVSSASINVKGVSYAVDDTGIFFAVGSGDGQVNATYKVTGVDGGGGVTSLVVTDPGVCYATATAVDTSGDGAQPGSGTGLTVDITVDTSATGTAQVDITYIAMDVLT